MNPNTHPSSVAKPAKADGYTDPVLEYKNC
jgi:hypothetical protein